MTSTFESESTFTKIVRLLRWHKPAGRLILMVPALWSLTLAATSKDLLPPLDLLIVVILGTLATSAAGCVINDLWDRDIDTQVERTRNRPLAARSLSITIGIVVLVIASLCAFFLAAYLNPLSFSLCLAAVPVIAIYPACKRVFPLPQLVLSIAWGFAVLIPWSAMTGNLDIQAWELWGATLAWTMGFDTVYALSDRPDDLKMGIKSSAIFFGELVNVAIAAFFILTTALLLILGWQMHLGYLYYLTCLIAVNIWAWQCLQLVKPELPSTIYQKIFGQNVWIGFIVLAGMLSHNFRSLSIW